MESKAISTLNSAMRGRGRGGRGRGSRGRRGGLARGRSKKNMKVIESDEDDMQQQQEGILEVHDENFPPKIDMEADISQLEAPTFTTINRGPPEPMLRLRWDHRVSLIGEKVLNPMIHCCDKCLKPILIYGRMIPCKHVFCLTCARDEEKACPKCLESVSRVEQTGLGTVFMCTHGGTRYGNNGCRRTYLSQRDLQAHINHRHSVGGDSSPNKVGLVSQVPPAPPPPQPRKIHTTSNQQSDPRNDNNIVTGNYRTQSTRTNLITVPIQQDQPPTPHYHHTQVPPQPMAGQSGPGQQPVQSSVNYLATQYNTYSGGYYQPPPPPPQPTQYPPPPPPQQYPPETQAYWAPHAPPPIQHHFYR